MGLSRAWNKWRAQCDGEQGVCSSDAESSDEAGGSRAEQELWAVARGSSSNGVSRAIDGRCSEEADGGWA